MMMMMMCYLFGPLPLSLFFHFHQLAKVRNLPVIQEGKVMGIVNVNDISDFSFSMEELGGKKAYMKNISQRKGLPKV